jgi:hypothetical protein
MYWNVPRKVLSRKFRGRSLAIARATKFFGGFLAGDEEYPGILPL